ncbi:MAG: tetratricopeptide repeat protein [Xanthobacteraceae bacterium]
MTDRSGQARAPGAAQDALQRAIMALNDRRPDEAERLAAAAAKANPRDPRTLYVLGSALLMQGRGAEAVAPLEAAARARHDGEIDTRLAMALRLAGRADDALARLKRAVKRRPPFPGAFHDLGCILGSLKRYDEAVDVFRQGLDVAPMMPELSVQLGYTLLQCRKWTEAKAAFARALDIVPALREPLLGLAKAEQELGDFAASADWLRRVLRLGSDPAIWHQLGRCLSRIGDIDAAYDCFRHAVRAEPARFGNVLTTILKAPRGRFWLKPSAARRFLQEARN